MRTAFLMAVGLLLAPEARALTCEEALETIEAGVQADRLIAAIEGSAGRRAARRVRRCLEATPPAPGSAGTSAPRSPRTTAS